jgi:phosphoglycerate dehydrogenase-like enzyme
MSRNENGIRFTVGVTHDIRRDDGGAVFDLSLLDEAGLEWSFLAEHGTELGPGDMAGYDALVCFMPRVPRAAIAGGDRLRLLARLGVGVDTVDLAACTEHGVLVTITPDGVRRPMASAAMAFLLALAHQLPQKDRHVRAGGFDRFAFGGTGLTGRTLGLIGVGNVGADLVRLVEPWTMRIVAHDPYVAEAPPGVELVELEPLLRESDFVVVLCPLTGETHGLLDADRLASLKPTAFLVNVARGPIVDQRALTEALREARLAGAALDVYEQEPVDRHDPLLALENVILSPHAIGLTDEIYRTSGESACRSVIAVAEGRVPDHVVNPDALSAVPRR